MKSKIVLILLMVAATSCFAQKWKGLVKGIEGRVGGNNNSQTTEQTQAIEQTETNNAKKNTAKLSTNPRVQIVSAYLTPGLQKSTQEFSITISKVLQTDKFQ